MRAEHIPRQQIAHRFIFTYSARQTLRAATAGDDTDFDFGLAEARAFAGDDNVARHRQFTAATKCKTVHRRDHRFRACGYGAPQLVRAAQQHFNCTGIRHLFNIGASGEGFFIAGEHEAAYRCIVTHLGQMFRQQLAYVKIQRIARIGTVDADEAYAFGRALSKHYGSGHQISLKAL